MTLSCNKKMTLSIQKTNKSYVRYKIYPSDPNKNTKHIQNETVTTGHKYVIQLYTEYHTTKSSDNK